MDLTARGPFSLLAKVGLASPQAAGYLRSFKMGGKCHYFCSQDSTVFHGGNTLKIF